MVDVPPDRRIFIRLDLDYYRTRAHPVRRELLAAAGLEERPLPCSGGAPTDSERRTHQPVLLCPHRSWPWWPHPALIERNSRHSTLIPPGRGWPAPCALEQRLCPHLGPISI